MKIGVIRHSLTDDVPLIHAWAKKWGHEMTLMTVCAQKPIHFPSPALFDALITVGGPQTASKIEAFPELLQEVSFLQKFIKLGKPVLAVCLGAQLLSIAFGAKAQKSPEPEFGNFPMVLTAAGKEDPIFKSYPEPLMGLHWHFDMMGLPENAVILAESQGCPVQAVRFRENIYGVQFHWDFTRQVLIKNLQKMLDHMPASNYVQAPEEMLLADFQQMQLDLEYLLDAVVNSR